MASQNRGLEREYHSTAYINNFFSTQSGLWKPSIFSWMTTRY